VDTIIAAGVPTAAKTWSTVATGAVWTATSARRLQDIVLRTPTTAGSQATLPIKKPQF